MLPSFRVVCRPKQHDGYEFKLLRHSGKLNKKGLQEASKRNFVKARKCVAFRGPPPPSVSASVCLSISVSLSLSLARSFACSLALAYTLLPQPDTGVMLVCVPACCAYSTSYFRAAAMQTPSHSDVWLNIGKFKPTDTDAYLSPEGKLQCQEPNLRYSNPYTCGSETVTRCDGCSG